MATEFVGDYCDSGVLRTVDNNGRYLHRDFGTTNVSPHGRPSVTGALDGKLLCSHRADATEPCPRPKNPKEAYRAVKRRQVEKAQIQNSFRSTERGALQRVGRNRTMQMARCSRLLETAASGAKGVS